MWGGVVPFDTVWRLGADRATQFTTSKDIRLGSVDVPAGSYSLWLVPSGPTSAVLVINRQPTVWGTAYDATKDLARVPLSHATGPVFEKLSIGIEDATLVIRWDTVTWRVPITVRSP